MTILHDRFHISKLVLGLMTSPFFTMRKEQIYMSLSSTSRAEMKQRQGTFPLRL